MAKFTEIPLEIFKKIILLVDKNATKNLMLTCKKLNSVGYNVSDIIKFIDDYMKPLESLPTNKNDKYFKIIESFYQYILKYKPYIEYARKKYKLLYNAILLNSNDYFYFVCGRISFYPTTICFNAIDLASKSGLVEGFNYFFKQVMQANCHTNVDNSKKNNFITDNDYFNFFVNACQGGHVSIIENLFLMENGIYDNESQFSIKINKINTIGHSNIAFDTACENGHVDIIKLLMQRPEFESIDNWNNGMSKALSHNHLEVALFLVTKANEGKQHALSKITRNSIFRMAVQNKHCSLIKALLVDSSSISKINWSFALKNALINERIELLNILLSHIVLLKEKNEIINTNISNMLIKLITKKFDPDLFQLMKKIENLCNISLYNENDIIDIALKKNSCYLIEVLLYFLILKLNEKPYPLNYQYLLNYLQIHMGNVNSDNLISKLLSSYNINNLIINKKSNNNISMHKNIIINNDKNYKKSNIINDNKNILNNISNDTHNNNINNVNKNNKDHNNNINNNINDSNINRNNNINNNDYKNLNLNLNNNSANNNKNVNNNNNKNNDSTINNLNILMNTIDWPDLIKEKGKVNLTQENWSQCLKLSITEHRHQFLYYLLHSYKSEYTSLLSASSWNKIFMDLLSSYKINIFSKIYNNIKSKTILLSPSTLNLLIEVLIRHNIKHNEILLNLTDKELSFMSKDHFNLILRYSVENNINLFIERLLQYRYKDYISIENKEFCLKSFVQSKNTKLFKLLLLLDKSLCTTTNRNYVYSYGNQEMKCFFNSI